MITVQQEDFSLADEYSALQSTTSTGAIVTFVGLVRDFSDNTQEFYLEHYRGMTERVLDSLIAQARQQWSILDARIIHRVGHLKPGDQIVFVGVCSAHRKDAFAACEFLIDMLKTKAPFWKKEGAHWVEAKASDQRHADDWVKRLG